jgi:hypothetical protein
MRVPRNSDNISLITGLLVLREWSNTGFSSNSGIIFWLKVLFEKKKLLLVVYNALKENRVYVRYNKELLKS